MKSSLSLALAVVLLVLGTQACSSSTTNRSSGDQTLFRDDFSSVGKWDRARAIEGVTDYKDGSFHIQVNAPNTDIWANPGLNFTDVRIEADATKIGGPENNEFGLICRYKDKSNFYFFAIGSDGYFGIFKVKDGQNILISRSEMSSSNAIKGEVNQNHLRADCVGSTLTFYVNGALLDQKEDAEFTSGDVGLIAGTYDEVGTEVLFDNFVVMRP